MQCGYLLSCITLDRKTQYNSRHVIVNSTVFYSSAHFCPKCDQLKKHLVFAKSETMMSMSIESDPKIQNFYSILKLNLINKFFGESVHFITSRSNKHPSWLITFTL
jgi:hypothetical protein